MDTKKGLFIVFEGIDGCGKSTQIGKLADYIHRADKYANILRTREPTGRADEIKSRLARDSDAFSGGKELAKLYVVDDRAPHVKNQIIPALEYGTFVLCDRFSFSTMAYQSTQGVPIDELIELHKQEGIIKPDITFYFRCSADTAAQRIAARGEGSEKFERNREFVERLVKQYDLIVELSKRDENLAEVLGPIITIDAERTPEIIFEYVSKEFLKSFKNR